MLNALDERFLFYNTQVSSNDILKIKKPHDTCNI